MHGLWRTRQQLDIARTFSIPSRDEHCSTRQSANTHLEFGPEKVDHRLVERVQLLLPVEDVLPQSGVGLEKNGCLQHYELCATGN